LGVKGAKVERYLLGRKKTFELRTNRQG